MKKKFLVWDNPCQAIYMLLAILIIVGCINNISAVYMEKGTLSALFKYLVVMGVSMIAGGYVRRKGYKKLLSPIGIWFVYGLNSILLIALVFMRFFVTDSESTRNGATRWIPLPGGLTIQPSEFAKLIVIVLCAYYLGHLMRKGKIASIFHDLTSQLIFGLCSFYMIAVYLQPDMGTAAIVGALFLLLFIMAGMPGKELGVLMATVAAVVVAGVIANPYRLERIPVWLDPWSEPLKGGYQMVQSQIAFASGGLKGMPWGWGAGKVYLPEAHTDFAFAFFCQENGFIGAFLLILVFALLGVACARITLDTRDEKGFLLAGGITFLIVGQAAANMLMVCGVLPVIGVPLSFISYGGSSMLTSMISMGLLLSVYDEEQKERVMDEMPPEERRQGLQVVSRRAGR